MKKIIFYNLVGRSPGCCPITCPGEEKHADEGARA
jgi:hypothetical protein